MQPLPRPSLITPPPLQPRQNTRLLLAVGGILVLGAAVLVVWKTGSRRPLIPREGQSLPAAEHTMTESKASAPDDLRLPTTYARLPIQKPPPAEPPPPATTVPATTTASLPREPATSGGEAPYKPTPPKGLRPPGAASGTAQSPPAKGTTTPVAAVKKDVTPPHRWFTAVVAAQGDTLTPPLPPDPQEAQAQPSKLFPKAVWEKPDNPYKVLYADQIVHGVLTTEVSSDIPGIIRIKTTEPVMDRWGHGHEILPVDTAFLGRQQGQANFGQTRLPAEIYMAILPNGTAIRWQNGQAGDALGQAGISATVDNHYLKLFIGVGLQAVLNVGTRIPFGSPGPGQVQQNLPQEFAQDASQGVNQAGQRILAQQFQVRPTLTQEFAYPVSLSFADNVSFQTQAITVKK